MLAHLAHGFDFLLALGGIFGAPDFLGNPIALGFEGFALLNQVAAFGVQRDDFINNGNGHLTLAQGCADFVGVFAEALDV